MVHLLTFIILFCSLSVQRWSGLKIVLSQEQRKGVKSGNKYLIIWTSIIPSSFPQRNSGFFRETGIIAGRTNVSTNKRSLRYINEARLHDFFNESITLSSLVRRALNTTCSIWYRSLLICFSCQDGCVLAPGSLRQTSVLFTAVSRVS